MVDQRGYHGIECEKVLLGLFCFTGYSISSSISRSISISRAVWMRVEIGKLKIR